MADDTEKFIQLEADEKIVYRVDGEHKTFEKGEKFSAAKGLAGAFLNDVGGVSKTGKTHEVENPETRVITKKQEFDETVSKQETSEDGYSYSELQKLAKEHGIKANQTKEELREQLSQQNAV